MIWMKELRGPSCKGSRRGRGEKDSSAGGHLCGPSTRSSRAEVRCNSRAPGTTGESIRWSTATASQTWCDGQPSRKKVGGQQLFLATGRRGIFDVRIGAREFAARQLVVENSVDRIDVGDSEAAVFLLGLTDGSI